MSHGSFFRHLSSLVWGSVGVKGGLFLFGVWLGRKDGGWCVLSFSFFLLGGGGGEGWEGGGWLNVALLGPRSILRGLFFFFFFFFLYI